MKTLILVRHAKSSWDNPDLKDFDRPLNERGKKDAPKMAARFKEKQITPAILLSSPAKRAIKTCKIFASELKYPETVIHTNPDLYHASENMLLKIVQCMRDDFNEIMIFGHNPGLNDFAEMLTGVFIENIPTCGMIAIQFPFNQWNKTAAGTGKILFFDFPKKFKSGDKQT
jgi:phosphohistidine phosphatase